MKPIQRAGALFLLALGSARAELPNTSCIACHDGGDAIVQHFRDDIHAQAGLSCQDCHGGNPDPKWSEDQNRAMDPKFKNPFIGKPKRAAIPEFCGRCHSSTTVMQKYHPGARVDQVREYWTSRHGIALKKGDSKVATCVDCHGVHGILAVSNPQAPVYRNRVAETCGKCHSDPVRMAGYRDRYGRPLPVDQYERWRRSVHAKTMIEKGDLSAPTCNNCHGNHGATPPGVDSIGNVCGQCHGREADLFRASAKKAGFAEHNKLLATASNCSDCHESKSTAAAMSVKHFGECVTCHDNHAIVRPPLTMLGALPETPCAYCHDLDTQKKQFTQTRDGLLKSAESAGLHGNARFDWLVDQALLLPAHTLEGGDSAKPVLRPEFARLFEKFRIGKTHFTVLDPGQKKEVSIPFRQCGDCHTAADSVGRKTAQSLSNQMLDLIRTTASAQDVLLKAQRGGVEVRAAQDELDHAVHSQIELEALVHSFDEKGAFSKKFNEGMTHAKAALQAGYDSLKELNYRHRGLMVALGLIILVLIALGLKIRELGKNDS